MATIISMLQNLNDNDGITLKRGQIITYKSGWQVADYGIETRDILEAAAEVERMQGSCGVWFAAGIYYVDHSFRVNTKKEAIAIGRQYSQISVFGWRSQNLAYC